MSLDGVYKRRNYLDVADGVVSL